MGDRVFRFDSYRADVTRGGFTWHLRLVDLTPRELHDYLARRSHRWLVRCVENAVRELRDVRYLRESGM